jgi:2'-5' RNA ligase
MSQKYVVVHFIDLQSVPFNFPMSEWPLHVTLLANFQTDRIDEAKTQLAELAAESKPFEIRVDGEASFGPQQSVAVSLIHPDDNIKSLHNKLLELANGLGAVFDEPIYNGDGYRPHATIQQKDRLRDQQTVTLNSFTLVDMFPDQDIQRRQVIKTYTLQ